METLEPAPSPARDVELTEAVTQQPADAQASTPVAIASPTPLGGEDAGTADAAAPQAPEAQASALVKADPEHVATDPVPCETTEMAPLSEAAPAARAVASRKRNGMIAGAILALAVLAGAGAWWLFMASEDEASAVAQATVPASEPLASSTPETPAPDSAQAKNEAKENEEDSTADAEPADARATASEEAALAARRAAEAARRQREAQANVQKKAQEAAQRAARAAAEQRAIEAAQQRALEAAQRAAQMQAPARPAARPSLPTPQQVCASQPNFITRAICESRECKRPEHTNTPYCIQMRKQEEAQLNVQF